MARKPLIDPNALNQGATTPLSTISRIVQRDREASGRVPSESAPRAEDGETAETNAAVQPTGAPANQLTESVDTPEESKDALVPLEDEEEKQPSVSPPPPRAAKGRRGLTEQQRRQAAEARVDEMARSPVKQIGPRIPGEWDDWLEDYVYARRKSGLQKQDLVRTIIREFIVAEMARAEGDPQG